MGKAAPAPIKHYLISLHLGREVMHGYLMSDDKRSLENAIHQMMDALDKAGVRPIVPIWLSTELSTDVETVRNLLRKNSPEVAALLDTARDYHFTAWLMATADPECERLMQLH
jgi:hypothetical protein